MYGDLPLLIFVKNKMVYLIDEKLIYEWDNKFLYLFIYPAMRNLESREHAKALILLFLGNSSCSTSSKAEGSQKLITPS